MALSRRRDKMYLMPHCTEEGIVLDLEPINDLSDLMLEGALQAQALVKNGVAKLQDVSHGPIGMSLQLICDELRGLLNYDRVMMYRFHEDQHGEVMAESFSRYAKDTFKGLHFPSTDIPQANRAIFMAMRSRMIANVAMEGSKVVQSARLSDNILLGASQLRGVSGCHGQYLSNMGVKATLVLSVVVPEVQTKSGMDGNHESRFQHDATRSPHKNSGTRGSASRNSEAPKERLWGLIVCHHYQSPHRVAYYQRSAAEFLVRIFAMHLGRSLQLERQKQEHALLQHQTAVCGALKHIEETGGSPDQIPMMMASVFSTGPGGRSLRLAANATGVAFIYHGTCQCVGNCPKVEEIQRLVAWMQSTSAAHELEVAEGAATVSTARRLPMGGIWSTSCLLEEGFPGAEAIKDTASGIIMVDVAPLNLSRYDGGGNYAWHREGLEGSLDTDAVEKENGEESGEKINFQPTTAVLAWFRGERIKEEAWAGDMHQPQGRHQGVELSPRESFEAIKELLCCESAPWEVHEKNSAAAMQLLIRDTISMCQQGQLSNRIMETLEQSTALYGSHGRGGVDKFSSVAEELRTIIGTADIPVIKVNTDLVISEHNKYAASILVGPCNRSAVGLAVTDFLEPKSVSVMQVTMRNVMGTMDPKPMMLRFHLPGGWGRSTELKLMNARNRAEEKAPKTRFRELLFFPQVRWGSSGEIAGLVLTGRDMSTHKYVMRSLECSTEIKQGERAGQVTEEADHREDRANVIANAVVPVASIDGNGRVVNWNAMMELATGLERKQAERKFLVGELFGSMVSLYKPTFEVSSFRGFSVLPEMCSRNAPLWIIST